jgi:FeS assembly ATPase SufC
MMPPGFYYKTFMYPQSLWETYEKFIRKAAGLGRSSTERDPDMYDKVNHHCDLMIVGAGPAGLAAALVAARSGARVILADEQSEFGGSLLDTRETLNGRPAAEWVATVVAELKQHPEVLLLPRSTVNGYHDHNFLTIHERCTDHLGDRAPAGQVRQRMHRVRANQVVLATGAHERPLVFGNNDVPGCMQAAAVSTYINRYAVVPGKELVLMTTNDHAYQAALDWHDAGRKVVAIVDTRQNPKGDRIDAAKSRGLKIIAGSGVIEVQGSEGVFLAFQYPVDIPGVSIANFLRASLQARSPDEELDLFDYQEMLIERMRLLDMDPSFAERSVNDGFSGGEKKRNEILQLAVLSPRLAIMDETDSGLDIDALKVVSSGVNALHAERPEMAVLMITHYQRILNYVQPEHVHVMIGGRIVRSGGADLARELEEGGYEGFRPEPAEVG